MSVYRTITVSVNFGPTFKHPPRDVRFRAVSTAAAAAAAISRTLLGTLRTESCACACILFCLIPISSTYCHLGVLHRRERKVNFYTSMMANAQDYNRQVLDKFWTALKWKLMSKVEPRFIRPVLHENVCGTALAGGG